jgi:hypothetical protein
MNADDPLSTPVDPQLEEVSDAIGRAATDLAAARAALDRERAEFAATEAQPSRSLLLAATRVVDELKQTDEALAALLKALERQTNR